MIDVSINCSMIDIDRLTDGFIFNVMLILGNYN